MGRVEPRDTSPLQAIMLSICLQSMVDELMVKKSGGSIRKVRVGLDVVSGVGSHPAPVTPRGLGCALFALRTGPAEGSPGSILTFGAAHGDPVAELSSSPADVSPAGERGPAALGQPASCEITPAAGEWDPAVLVGETSVTMGFTVCWVPEPTAPRGATVPLAGLGQAQGRVGLQCPTPVALGRETKSGKPNFLGEGREGSLASAQEGGWSPRAGRRLVV